MRGLNWIIVLAGVLAIIAPFVFGFSTLTAPMLSNIIVGALLVIIGVVAVLYSSLGTARVLDWIAALLGLWLIISPFVLGLAAMTTALWTNVVLGAIALVLGVWTAMTERPAMV